MIPLVMPPLAGLQMLVTRPAAQADGLCARVEQLGGLALRLPVLQIKPLTLVPPIQTYDLLLFISTNAVAHGKALIDMQPQARLAAVGMATAQALIDLGHAIDVMPEHAASSEALLVHPLLQSPPPRVLIVRGSGGRELLRETLQSRGSEVDIAEVYDRMVTTPDSAQMQQVENALQAGELDIISVTSVAILQALYELLHGQARELAQHCALLVGSARIAAMAKQLGWSGQYVVASSPEDNAMINAVTHWHTRAR